MNNKNTESNQAIDRLLQEIENKPKVTRREDTVLNKGNPNSSPKTKKKRKPTSHSSVEEFHTNSQTSTANSLEAMEMANTRVNIEKSIYNSLKALVMAEEISRDSFVEASYLYLADNPKALEAVIEIARKRNQLRKQKGNILRAQTLQKKYSP